MYSFLALEYINWTYNLNITRGAVEMCRTSV